MRPFLAAVLIAMAQTAFADEAGIQIDHAWSRAAMAGHEGVVYLTITDTGTPGHPDRHFNTGRRQSRATSESSTITA